jgi:hypothetical protein
VVVSVTNLSVVPDGLNLPMAKHGVASDSMKRGSSIEDLKLKRKEILKNSFWNQIVFAKTKTKSGENVGISQGMVGELIIY